MNLDSLVAKLETNRFVAKVFENSEECLNYLKDKVYGKVSVGGSVTLFETGIIKWLEEADNIEYIDRYANGDTTEILREAQMSNCYITSSNAVTMDGMLYNVDARGNRVAALTFGPEKVFVVVGTNKIVNTLEEAIDRVEKIAAPKNSVRLKRNNPCALTNQCHKCNSDGTICSTFAVTRRSQFLHRIEVLIIKEELGY